MSDPLLLDTHAYVWMVSAPDKLSDRAREALTDRGHPLLVSAATAWEMAIKHRSGRWPEVEPLLASHLSVLERLGATSLPISAEHAVRAGGLGWDHQDPFDRVLAAQALTCGATLVTRDRAFADLGGLVTLW